MKALSELKPGERGAVCRVAAEGAVKRHLLHMGITTGATITLLRAAPFGDPLAIRLRGYSLLLRRAQAEQIMLEVKHERDT